MNGLKKIKTLVRQEMTPANCSVATPVCSFSTPSVSSALRVNSAYSPGLIALLDRIIPDWFVTGMLVAGLVIPGIAQSQPNDKTAAQAESAASELARIQPLGPTSQRNTWDEPAALQSFGWLAVVLLGFGFAAFVVARSKGIRIDLSKLGLQGRTEPPDSAKPVVMSRTALSPQAAIFAVRWGDEELLLGSTSHAVTLIARKPVVAKIDTVERQ
jgi:hypothetical protein